MTSESIEKCKAMGQFAVIYTVYAEGEQFFRESADFNQNELFISQSWIGFHINIPQRATLWISLLGLLPAKNLSMIFNIQ